MDNNIIFNVIRTGDTGGRGVDRLSRSLGRLRGASQNANRGMGKLVGTIARMTKLMSLRAMIRAVMKAMNEGMKNAYQYSAMMGGKVAQALDSLKQASSGAINGLGSAFAELLATIAPILNAIISLATAAANAIARLFAVLGGRSTYSKAVKTSEKWAEATAGGAAAAEEWKNQLMGFDEINKLEDQDSGGGGGGGADIGSMFEEEPAINEWASKLREITLDWWNSLDFEPIIAAWGRLTEAVGKFVSLVDDALYWAYTEVLLPLAGWTIEEGAPAAVNLLASALNFVTAALDALSPAFTWFYEKVIQPVAAFIGDVLVTVMNFLADTFQSLADKITNAKSLSEFLDSLNGDEAFILGVAAALTVLVAAITALKVVKTISKIFSAAFTVMTNPVLLVVVAVGLLAAAVITHWDEIKAAITEAKAKVEENINGVKEILENFVNQMKDFGKRVVDGFINGLKDLKNRAAENFRGVLDLIRGIFGVHSPSTVMAEIGGYVTEGFANGIKEKQGLVSSAINGIKGLFDGLVAKAASAWDSISGFMSRIINKASSASSSVSTVSINTASASKVSGMKLGGIHARASGGTVDTGELYLAREAGSELVGRIGSTNAVMNNDQIVSAVAQGVASAVSSVMGGGRGGASQVVFNINGKEFARAVYNDMRSVSNERGTSLVKS